VSVLNALKCAKTKSSQAHEAKKNKYRQLTSRNLIYYFSSLCETARPITKDTFNKLNGFITLLRNNGWTDEQIYEFIEESVENWPKGKKAITNKNRKEYILDTQPNLQDIIVCSNWFMDRTKEDEQYNLWEILNS